MTKKLRKIEQETRITREDFDQLFEIKQQRVSPPDEYELQYLKQQKQGSKIEELKQNKKEEGFDEFLFKEQDKVNKLNQEFQLLKSRLF